MALNGKDSRGRGNFEILKVTILEGGSVQTEIELPTVARPEWCGVFLADIVMKFAEYFEKRGGPPDSLHIIMDMLLCVVNNHINPIVEKTEIH